MFSHGSQLRSVVGLGGLVSLYGIASMLVYYMGPSFGVSYGYQIVLIALILLTWPFALVVNSFRRRRLEKRLAAEGATPEAKPAKPARGAGKETPNAPTGTYEEITRSAEEAVQWLRSTKLNEARAGATDAVYALPWFIVAGTPASGKTSLVLSSGFNFQMLPSQRAAEQRLVRPTRGCDWRMTDNAVLLDTAGRYQADGEHRDEWAALVETVKKHRARRPLDGYVIVASLDWLLRASEAEVEQTAKALRAALDDCSMRAGARFPVYLVWTHADTVEGFRTFFGNMRREERAQVWGATIPLAQSQNAHALFDTEFDLLFDSLMRQRLIRLGATEPPADQLRVFNFPPRAGETRSSLGLFTSVLFRPNPFSESPLLRGFYFTANVAPNANGNRTPRIDAPPASAAPPRDGATNVLSAPPAGAAAMMRETTPRAVGEGFFSEGFFKDVLLRDKDLAAAFQPLQTRNHRLRIAGVAAAAVLAVMLLTAFTISFFANRRLVAEAAERGARVDAIVRQDAGADPTKKQPAAARVEVEAIEELRETVAQLDSYERDGRPLHMRFGLYAGERINPQLRTIYFEAINQRYFKPALAAVETDLQTFAANANAAPATPANSAEGTATTDASAEETLGKNYDLLKAYLMVSDAPDKVEPTFLANGLADYWVRSSPPDMELVSRRQLDFYASQVRADDAPRRKPVADLIASARARLVAYPAVNRVYKRITTDVNAKVQPVSLDAILTGRGAGILASSFTVPGSYTYEGYHSHIAPAFDTAAEEISGEDWVMGSIGASSTTSLAADTSRLKSLYFRDYADHWRRFLRATSVASFKTKDDAVTILSALTANDSPLERVIEAVTRNTDLSAQPAVSGFWNKIKAFFSRRKTYDTGGNTEPEREFRPLHAYAATGEASTDANAMTQYRSALQGVLDNLEVASADQLTQTSRALLTGKDDIGLTRAQQTVARMLDPFKTPAAREAADLLKQPLGNLRAMLYGGGYEQIVREWRDQIQPNAKRLESGFPFTEEGASSVTDLARFLNPTDGQLTQFFNNRLASSFEDVQGQYKLKETGAIRFSDEFVAYLNNARSLREAMFSTNNRTPEVAYDFTLQPAANTDILIEIDGTRIETRGTSPTSAKFTFPARAGSTSGAKITVVAEGKDPAERTFPGEWGLFKMFTAGGAQAAGENGYALTWNVGGVPVRATLRPSSQTNPFNRQLFTNMRVPQSIEK